MVEKQKRKKKEKSITKHYEIHLVEGMKNFGRRGDKFDPRRNNRSSAEIQPNVAILRSRSNNNGAGQHASEFVLALPKENIEC